MSEKFTIEIITPEKSLVKTDASEVNIPSYEGEMGILKDHIPIITFLRPGIIVIMNEDKKNYYVEEGTVEFSNNNLLVLSSTAKEVSDLEKNSLNTMISEAEKKLSTKSEFHIYCLSLSLAFVLVIKMPYASNSGLSAPLT